MHKLFLLFFVFFFSLLQSQNFRLIKDTMAFKQKVEQMSKQTNSLQSNFVQVKDLSMLSEKITSKGNFCFSKPNNLRWEYTTPYMYIIVITKDKMLIKDENKTKKYDINSNKIFKEINDIMVASVDGTIIHSNKFKMNYFENEKGYKLELLPQIKAMKESLKRINMYFDKNVSSVVKLEMIEPGDDTTTIEFTDKKINESIPPEKFMLK